MKLNEYCIKELMIEFEKKSQFENPKGLKSSDYNMKHLPINPIIEDLSNVYSIEDLKYAYRIIRDGLKYVISQFDQNLQCDCVYNITIEGHNYLKQFHH